MRPVNLLKPKRFLQTPQAGPGPGPVRDRGAAVKVTQNGRATSAEASKGNRKPNPTFGLIP